MFIEFARDCLGNLYSIFNIFKTLNRKDNTIDGVLNAVKYL